MQYCRTRLLLVALAGLTLAGCVSAHKLDQALAIPIGMNEVQVANKIGEPMVKDQDENGTERWIWARKGQFGPESVTLIMKDGRVAAIESQGERLKHIEELQRLEKMEELLEDKTAEVQSASRSAQTNRAVTRTIPQRTAERSVDTTLPPRGSEHSGAAADLSTLEAPTGVKHEKSSEQIWREQEEALTEARREARKLEEGLRELVEKAREAEKAATERALAETNSTVAAPAQEIPALTAWYMARQFVGERLDPNYRRRLFPNPRFTDAAGEERMNGNVWRAWGYVDTIDEKNKPKRVQWTAELEFEGGTKWKLKTLAFGEK